MKKNRLIKQLACVCGTICSSFFINTIDYINAVYTNENEFKTQDKYKRYTILKVPNEIDGVQITTVGPSAFANSPTFLKTLDMSECVGITALQDSAFNQDEGIDKVILLQTLKQ